LGPPGQNPLHGVGCAQIAGAGFEIGLRMSLANRFDCLIDVFLRPTVDDGRILARQALADGETNSWSGARDQRNFAF